MAVGALALGLAALVLSGFVVWRLASLLSAEREAHRAEVGELLTRIQHPHLIQLQPQLEQSPLQAFEPDHYELAGRDFGDGGPIPDYESERPPFPTGEMP